MAVITRYFTQNGSFRSQLCQLHTEARPLQSATKMYPEKSSFLAIGPFLWGTTSAISAVAELLVVLVYRFVNFKLLMLCGRLSWLYSHVNPLKPSIAKWPHLKASRAILVEPTIFNF